MDGKSNFTIKVLLSSFRNYFRDIYRINIETVYRNYLQIAFSTKCLFVSSSALHFHGNNIFVGLTGTKLNMVSTKEIN